jgi:excinuclease ABC subunit C
VHVGQELADAPWLEEWLSYRSGGRVRLVVPKRGEKRALLELATRNASLAYDSRFNQEGTANYEALDVLRTTFGLAGVPRRIECFDISTIQGSETVASMVVCEGGRMKRSEYRKFRVRGSLVARADGLVAPDDFAAMREVVTRRYRRVLEEAGALPDLILIDGGPGQLSAAYQALAEVGPGGGWNREEGRARVHARSRRADCATARQSGAASAPAHQGRGSPLCRHVPSAGAVDAGPAIGA